MEDNEQIKLLKDLAKKIKKDQMIRGKIELVRKEPILEYFDNIEDVTLPIKQVKILTPLTKAQADYAETVDKTELKQLSEDYANEIEKMREEDLTKGKKESNGKLHIEYNWDFLEAQFRRMGRNKVKYDEGNWTKPMDVDELKKALMRHVLCVMKGDMSDDGDEYGHLAAIALNVSFIDYQLKNYK